MFGRRSSGDGKGKAADIPRHPGPDADGVSRVIPQELWDGPTGDFLRKVGLSADDPSNLMKTQESVQARMDELCKTQDAFVAAINEQMPPSAKVIPWAMIPWSCWRQQHADFLLGVCELFPVDPWNMMLLPEDEASALVLDLPQHLHGIPAGLEDAANRLIGEIRQEFSEAHERTGAALAQSDLSSLDEYRKARDETVSCVVGLAHALGAQTYGEEAYGRHRVMFGDTLGWNGAGR